jgi:hypothetical protein
MGWIIHMTTICGLFEPLYRYDIDDFRRLLSALTRGGNPKILYIEYDYSDEGEHFVKIVDQEFKALLEKKGVALSTDEVDYVSKDDLKEFLKQKGAMSLFIVEIEDGEDTAAVVAYI